MLRTNVLARLLLERILSLGPMTELAAMECVEWREPGRSHEVIEWACAAGMIRRDPGEPATIEAAGAPRRARSHVSERIAGER